MCHIVCNLVKVGVIAKVTVVELFGIDDAGGVAAHVVGLAHVGHTGVHCQG